MFGEFLEIFGTDLLLLCGLTQRPNAIAQPAQTLFCKMAITFSKKFKMCLEPTTYQIKGP